MSLLLLRFVRVPFTAFPYGVGIKMSPPANTTATEYCLRFNLWTTRIFGDIPSSAYLKVTESYSGLVRSNLAREGMGVISCRSDVDLF